MKKLTVSILAAFSIITLAHAAEINVMQDDGTLMPYPAFRSLDNYTYTAALREANLHVMANITYRKPEATLALKMTKGPNEDEVYRLDKDNWSEGANLAKRGEAKVVVLLKGQESGFARFGKEKPYEREVAPQPGTEI